MEFKGQAGRQGDPGESQVLTDITDRLVVTHSFGG